MKKKLHIGYIVSHYPHPSFGDDGGLGTSVYILAEKIRRQDCHITVFVYGQTRTFTIEEENMTLYSIRDFKDGFLKFYRHRKFLEKFIKDKIKTTGIDLIEAPDWTGITAFMRFPVPLVVRFHGSDAYFCHLEQRQQKWKNFLFEKWAVRHADAYIAPTAFAGKLSAEIFNLRGREIRTIHYGLEVADFQNEHPERYQYGSMLYLGTLIRKKGVLELPEIFRLVLQQNSKARLVLIGGDSYDIQTGSASTWELVKQQFSEAELESVTYLGKVPYHEVKEYITSAHVCVFPTFAETLGMVTIESMALQKPVINSDIGWSQELIQDGDSGYLVHPKNHALYAERILELFRSENQTTTMGKAARAQVEARFDINKIVHQNLDFYREVISRK